jgi:hypothetical protein
MKVKVFCRLDSNSFSEEIVCDSYFIRDGAYIFLDKGGFSTYNYSDVIKTFPVMFTIVERIIE